MGCQQLEHDVVPLTTPETLRACQKAPGWQQEPETQEWGRLFGLIKERSHDPMFNAWYDIMDGISLIAEVGQSF